MKNRFFAAIVAAVLSVGAFSTPVQTYIGAQTTAYAATTTKVATPKCSRPSGKYYVSTNLKVTLSCSTSDATIYYSTDGGTTYKRYSKALYLTKNTTLKFYAIKSGVKSKVLTRTYKLLPKFTITPSAGTYDSSQTVKLSSSVPGLKFYYTLDGSTPTTKSALYNAKGIVIEDDCTLRVRASKSGWTARIVTKKFTINKTDITDVKPSITIEDESILDNYKDKYGYNTLNDMQKELYELIYKGVNQHLAEIDVFELKCNTTDLEKAFFAMDYDNPQLFWLDSGYTYSHIANTIYYINPRYTRTAKEAAAIQPKLEEAADKIVAEILKKDSLFERVNYIHDVIVNRTDYVLTGGAHISDADGVLLNGRALCEGYSKAFAYLCQSVGIETFCVIGRSNNESHMWNIVKLDGEWYHMDVTFDDPVSDVPTCSYTFFGLTQDAIEETHSIIEIVPLPKATATKYNYYNAMNIPVYDNVETAYNMLVVQAALNYKNNVLHTEVICTTDCAKALHKFLSDKGSEIFTDLDKCGCTADGLSRGYKGSTYFFDLT